MLLSDLSLQLERVTTPILHVSYALDVQHIRSNQEVQAKSFAGHHLRKHPYGPKLKPYSMPNVQRPYARRFLKQMLKA